MKILLAPDSFKGSLTARQVCLAMTAGIRRVLPEAEIIEAPMADGGEGTLETLLASLGGQRVPSTVTGPLGNPVEAVYGILSDGCTGIIEMASASGLILVPENLRDPRLTTSLGTGELIRAALNSGCSRIILGIGGSATNDGGTGMAQALGFRFLDRQGASLPLGGLALRHLAKIDVDSADPRIAETEFRVACDVANPLIGAEGASRVYAPQKGACPEVVVELEDALACLAYRIQEDIGMDLRHLPGGGAAGGMGAGLVAFCGGKLQSGFEIIADLTNFYKQLSGADLVITGEGRIDRQSIQGKTPVGVGKLAKTINLPVLAIAGGLGPGAEMVYHHGIDGIMPITRSPIRLEEAIKNADVLVESATENLLRIFLTGRLPR